MDLQNNITDSSYIQRFNFAHIKRYLILFIFDLANKHYLPILHADIECIIETLSIFEAMWSLGQLLCFFYL